AGDTNAPEGKSARTDGAVDYAERRTGGRRQGINDRGVVLSGANRCAATRSVEGDPRSGCQTQPTGKVYCASGVRQINGISRRRAGRNLAAGGPIERRRAACLGVNIHRVIRVVVLRNRAVIGDVGGAGVFVIGDARWISDRGGAGKCERAGTASDDINARIAAVERIGAIEVYGAVRV